MSRRYSPKSFLRQVPNPLLRMYFSERGALTRLPWEILEETTVNQIYDDWQSLPEALRADIDREFHGIHEMACHAGMEALLEEGTFHGLTLTNALERQDGLYAKAMWAFLYHRKIFDVAGLFVSADALFARYWFRRKGLPRIDPATSPAATGALADAISDYYSTTQGRGHHCTVETYLRRGRQFYYFAYPDDYPDIYIGHDDEGAFVRRPQKQAFEVVFVFDPSAGTLELHAQGDKGVRARLFYIFCSVILGINPPPERLDRPPYELQGLLSRESCLGTDPEDGIVEVVIRRLRLSVNNRRLILEADAQAGAKEIYEMMAECLHPTLITQALVRVTQVEFQLRYASAGDKRQKPLVFSVSAPNSSNIKNLAEEQRLLAEKYLRRWGIQRD